MQTNSERLCSQSWPHSPQIKYQWRLTSSSIIINTWAAAAAKSLQSCPTLCDPTDSRPPGSRIPGILQAITLEWVAISFSRGSSQPRDRTQVSCTAGGCFTVWATRETYFLLQCIKVKSESEVTQSCPTLSDPMDCSPPGSSVHGILQARALEWGAIAESQTQKK